MTRYRRERRESLTPQKAGRRLKKNDEHYRRVLDANGKRLDVAGPTAVDKTPGASPVRIIRADGTTTELPALNSAELAKVVSGREVIPLLLRKAVIRRDRRLCRYCGRQPRSANRHIDHVIPVIEGGATSFDNLVLACRKCNLQKGVQLWTPIPLDEVRKR